MNTRVTLQKLSHKNSHLSIMSSSHQPLEDDDFDEEEAAMLDPDEAAEEIPEDMDAAMDSGDEDEIQEEIQLQNDSAAHFDLHKDSIFAIAQHPLYPNIVAIGGSEGEDADGYNPKLCCEKRPGNQAKRDDVAE